MLCRSSLFDLDKTIASNIKSNDSDELVQATFSYLDNNFDVLDLSSIEELIISKISAN